MLNILDHYAAYRLASFICYRYASNPFSPHRESANFWVLHRRLDEEAHIFETENIGSEFIRP
jgi:hypothetical protein